MSMESVAWALVQSVSAVPKLLLVVLGDAANYDRDTWVSVRTISARTGGMNKSTITRNIKTLIDAGLVSKSERYDGKRQTSNTYHLHLDQGVQPYEGARSATLPRRSAPPSPDALRHPLILKNKELIEHDPKTSHYRDPDDQWNRWHTTLHTVDGFSADAEHIAEWDVKCLHLERWIYRHGAHWDVAYEVADSMSELIQHDPTRTKNQWIYAKANGGGTSRYSDLRRTFRSWYKIEMKRRGLDLPSDDEAVAAAEAKHGGGANV